MNRELFFESCGDERGTPAAFFDALNAEFHFTLDAAASAENAKCDLYFGFGSDLGTDALEQDWGGEGSVVWLNPPYSVAGAFVAKAREEADKGATVVLLLPARTDTKWWHTWVWDRDARREDPDGDWRPGVRGRFVPGRLSFELKVPPAMRALVKAEINAVRSSCDNTRELTDELARVTEKLIETTGLPAMAIKGIADDKIDEDLLSSAPFPSAVVIFERTV